MCIRDSFKVSGRGELHLSILIEQMRRQNYEFQVSSPQVIYKEVDGKRYEPIELLMIEVPDNYVGAVMEKLGSRKAELQNMGSRDTGVTLSLIHIFVDHHNGPFAKPQCLLQNETGLRHASDPFRFEEGIGAWQTARCGGQQRCV